MKLKSILAITLSLMVLTQCSKDQTHKGDDSKTVTLSRKTDYGNDWIYFSFSKGAEVQVSEENHLEDMTWDIAFNRDNVRTNGGKSGMGKGGAYDTGAEDFNKEFEALEDSKLTLDIEGEIAALKEGDTVYPTGTVQSSFNEVLNDGIVFRVTSSGPAYDISKNVYIVRTANGEYVKLLFVSYHNAEGESGTVNFKYTRL